MDPALSLKQGHVGEYECVGKEIGGVQKERFPPVIIILFSELG
jgi:hypothetical protein